MLAELIVHKRHLRMLVERLAPEDRARDEHGDRRVVHAHALIDLPGRVLARHEGLPVQPL